MNTTTRYYAKVTKMISQGNDRIRRKGLRIANQQVELWSQDRTCPWDESSSFHSDFIEDWSEEYHGEASLDDWLDLIG